MVVVSRSPKPGEIFWAGKTIGPWAEEVDGSDVVINLAGRSVNCRYTEANLQQMLASRVESTQAVGKAIAAAARPPKVWLQASTATIYAHRFDSPNDEYTGILGGDEESAPSKWLASIAIAKAWEKTLEDAHTPQTRKIAMRSAMTMSADKGSIFDVMQRLARRGFFGTLGNGRQYVSWIHEVDFTRAVEFLISHEQIEGPVNLSSPNPLPQAEFSKILRQEVGNRISLPAPKLLLELGTWAMRTESELVLKSRRVVPSRLLGAGFQFEFPDWQGACKDLLMRR